MRGTGPRALGVLLLGSVLVGFVLADSTVAGASPFPPPSLLMGVLGAALLYAWGAGLQSAVVLVRASGSAPAVAARDHHRALARRAVPRQRDPDAPGHTRSRAPSELLPAV